MVPSELVSSKDDELLYKSRTNGFSLFAITGNVGGQMQDTQQTENQESKTNIQSSQGLMVSPEEDADYWLIGIVFGLLAIGVLIVYIYYRNRRR